MKALPLARGRQSDDCRQNPVARGKEQSRLPLKAVGIKFLVGLMLMGFVVLLTALFSFVGTITCCVLFGMMLGGVRGSKWSAVSVSVLLPVVTVALLQFPAPAVSWQKALTLAALCFATFWVMYFLTRCLTSSERKSNLAAHVAKNPTPPMQRENSRAGASRVSEAFLLSSASRVASSLAQPDLAGLQGQWVSRRQPGHALGYSEAMEFTGEKLSFKRTDSDGNLQLCWEGSVKCESLGPFKTIKVFKLNTHPGSNSDDSTESGQTWVYRVNAQTLTIALQFETGCDGNPISKEYRKIENHPHPRVGLEQET